MVGMHSVKRRRPQSSPPKDMVSRGRPHARKRVFSRTEAPAPRPGPPPPDGGTQGLSEPRVCGVWAWRPVLVKRVSSFRESREGRGPRWLVVSEGHSGLLGGRRSGVRCLQAEPSVAAPGET